MSAWVYRGRRLGAGASAPNVVTGDNRPLSPAPSLKLRNHSPDGFNWGYGGSGPAQLALGLLLDHTGDPQLAQDHYQSFKSAFVAGWPDSWELTGAQIDEWLATQGVRT